MEFEPTSHTIDKLIRWVETGKLALPEFQREFVWSPGHVAEFLDSISRGWPVGSLLLLEGPQKLQAKALDAAPTLRGQAVAWYLLDGQQRVTALYHALSDVSDVVYYIDFTLLETGEEEYVRWERRSIFEKDNPTVEDRAAKLIAKVCEVSDAEKFHSWQAALAPDLSKRITMLREKYLPGLRSLVYKMPAVALGQEIELEALARIFETINRTGIRLNAFDLMVAVLYPDGFHLRDQWDVACAENSLLEHFRVDGVEILKVIALWERRNQQRTLRKLTIRGVRQGDILALDSKRIRASWDPAISAYVAALDRMRDRYGVAHYDTIPARAMVLTLAFLIELKADTQTIDRWYWSSVSKQTYAHGANTRVVADVDAIVKSGEAFQKATDKQVLREALLEPIRRNQMLLRGVVGLLVSRGALDPISGNRLGSEAPVAYCNSERLLAGSTRPDLSKSPMTMLFGSEKSLQRLAAEARKGSLVPALINTSYLATQESDIPSILGRAGLAEATKRARVVAEWLLAASEGRQ